MYNFKIKSYIHDYDVTFTDDFSVNLAEILKDGDVIVIDKKVKGLYANKLDEIIKDIWIIEIEANENQKSYQGIIPVIRELIENGFKRNHRLIAIGGGITQDITAFIASILYRGVEWNFFPTTLLAQGDSCIGSKTSINFDKYKNQVGGFYPPSHIIIDPEFLKTLDFMDLKSGLGEMCHYFIVASKEDFIYYKKNYDKLFKDQDVLAAVIKRSLEIKKSYIEIDEFDKKERQVFNYGHSFGHAIETLTNYRIPHGIAVAYGMDIANFISVKLGYIDSQTREEIRELLHRIWEGTHLEDISIDNYKVALSKDKKNVGTELRIILNKGYGKIFKDKMKMDDQFVSWMEEYFSNELN